MKKKFIIFNSILISLMISLILIIPSIIYPLNLPELTGRVVDKANVLSPVQFSNMSKRLEKYEEETGNQMVVCFIESLNYYTIEDYSIRLAEKWKIGYKGKDNGIIMLFAMEDRKMRIEVGYGLEPYLTDSEAKLVIEKILVPAFKKGRYYDGIMNAIDIIEKETRPDPDDIISRKYKTLEPKLIIKERKQIRLFILILFFIGLIQSILFVLLIEEKLSYIFFLVSLILGLLYISFFSLIIKLEGYNFGYLLLINFAGSILGLIIIINLLPSPNGRSYSSSSSSSSSSYSSYSNDSYSSSSGSGFSGGGGSFGGGGASGSW